MNVIDALKTQEVEGMRCYDVINWAGYKNDSNSMEFGVALGRLSSGKGDKGKALITSFSLLKYRRAESSYRQDSAKLTTR
jgi:hypothetical protein